jgi:predicted ATPase
VHILKLKLENHPGIGDLEIDFTGGNNSPFPVIVIAGANGTGKSAIFEAIFQTLSFNVPQHKIGIISLTVLLSATEKSALAQHYSNIDEIITIRHDSNNNSNFGEIYKFTWNAGGSETTRGYDGERSRVSGLVSLFSEAAVEYNIKLPRTITTLELDKLPGNIRSSSAFGDVIAQLLVDIRNADAEELAAWVDKNPGSAPPPSVQNVRFRRFLAAFEHMWPTKKFLGVSRNSGGLSVEFTEFGRTSSLDQLSTGEKQVIIRGGFFLRHQEKIGGALILLDEPELSLHPAWQSKVLGFYRQITKQSDGTHPQLVVATHSPFIVHGAPDSKVVILEKDSVTGQISQSPDPTFPISKENVAVRAFSLQSFLDATTHNTTVLTEGETDATLIKLAWEKLRPGHDMPFQVKAALGAKNINITFNDQEFVTKLGAKNVIGVFDFDGEGYNQWKGVWKSVAASGSETTCLVKAHSDVSAFAVLLPVPSHRADLASLALAGRSMMAIEMLFEDGDIPSEMTELTLMPGGSFIPSVRSGSKTAFSHRAATLDQESFAHFEPLIQAIESRVG